MKQNKQALNRLKMIQTYSRVRLSLAAVVLEVASNVGQMAPPIRSSSASRASNRRTRARTSASSRTSTARRRTTSTSTSQVDVTF